MRPKAQTALALLIYIDQLGYVPAWLGDIEPPQTQGPVQTLRPAPIVIDAATSALVSWRAY